MPDPSLTVLTLGLLILAVALIGLGLILGLLLSWRRQQHRLRHHRGRPRPHLDTWRVAGLRYRDPADRPDDPDNPFTDEPPAPDDDEQGPDDADGPENPHGDTGEGETGPGNDPPRPNG